MILIGNFGKYLIIFMMVSSTFKSVDSKASSLSSSLLLVKRSADNNFEGDTNTERESEAGGRHTAYGCEGTTLEINCNAADNISKDGQHRLYTIEIVRANFGRFSISICNPSGITNWSVNCMQPKTLRIVNARCDGKPNCTIPVDASIFGDACPSTEKYVEVHYTCRESVKSDRTQFAVENALANVSPSNHPASSLPSAHSSNSSPFVTTLKDLPSPSKSKKSPVDDLNSQPPWLLDLTATPPAAFLPKEVSDKLTEDVEVDENDSNLNVTQVSVDDLDANSTDAAKELVEKLCDAIIANQIHWKRTKVGEYAVERCPKGSKGILKYRCTKDTGGVSTGVWDVQGPSFTDCKSNWLINLDSEIQIATTHHQLLHIGAELSVMLRERTVFGGDLNLIIKIIQSLVHAVRRSLVSTSRDKKSDLVMSNLVNILKTLSLFMSGSSPSLVQAWSGIDSRQQKNVYATQLLLAMEASGILVATTINREKTMYFEESNAKVSVRVMRTHGASDQTFPDDDDDTSKDSQSKSKIVFPARSLHEIELNSAIRLVFHLLHDEMSLFPPLHTEEVDQISGRKYVVNSAILGATAIKGNDKHFSNPLIFTLNHVQEDGVEEAICASWDYEKHTWKDGDCALLNSNRTHTVCACHKLSSYAILMRRVSVMPTRTLFPVHKVDENFLENSQRERSVREQSDRILEAVSSSLSTIVIVSVVVVLICGIFFISVLLLIKYIDFDSSNSKHLSMLKSSLFDGRGNNLSRVGTIHTSCCLSSSNRNTDNDINNKFDNNTDDSYSNATSTNTTSRQFKQSMTNNDIVESNQHANIMSFYPPFSSSPTSTTDDSTSGIEEGTGTIITGGNSSDGKTSTSSNNGLLYDTYGGVGMSADVTASFNAFPSSFSTTEMLANQQQQHIYVEIDPAYMANKATNHVTAETSQMTNSELLLLMSRNNDSSAGHRNHELSYQDGPYQTMLGLSKKLRDDSGEAQLSKNFVYFESSSQQIAQQPNSGNIMALDHTCRDVSRPSFENQESRGEEFPNSQMMATSQSFTLVENKNHSHFLQVSNKDINARLTASRKGMPASTKLTCKTTDRRRQGLVNSGGRLIPRQPSQHEIIDPRTTLTGMGNVMLQPIRQPNGISSAYHPLSDEQRRTYFLA